MELPEPSRTLENKASVSLSHCRHKNTTVNPVAKLATWQGWRSEIEIRQRAVSR